MIRGPVKSYAVLTHLHEVLLRSAIAHFQFNNLNNMQEINVWYQEFICILVFVPLVGCGAAV